MALSQLLRALPSLGLLFTLLLRASHSKIVFRLSNGTESQVEMCSRLGLVPAGLSSGDRIVWNLGQVEAVTRFLHRRVAKRVVVGCCAPGLWCNREECFTQSLSGFFSNSAEVIADYSPVFTCQGNRSNSLDSHVSALTFSAEDATVDFSLTDVGTDSSQLQVSLGSKPCHFAELCSRVCSPCALNSDCPSDSLCVGDGYSSHCFAHCGGEGDESCPCNQSCLTVAINAGLETHILHLCAPHPFKDSFSLSQGACKGYSSNTSVIECSTNAFFSSPNRSNISKYSVSLYIGGNNSSHIGVDYIATPSFTCQENRQCDDGDVCTLNWCEDGRCWQRRLDSECVSTILDVQENVHPKDYFVILQRNQHASQDRFLDSMHRLGTTSIASKSFDAPELVDLGFKFLYFGNLVDRLAISPNGLLLVPPFLPCLNPIGSMEVILVEEEKLVFNIA